jgi:hypothetical protein
VSPAGGLARLGGPAGLGGLTRRLLPEQLDQYRGLAVVDIAGRGEQRDRAGGRQSAQVIQRVPGSALRQLRRVAAAELAKISPGRARTRCEVRGTAPRPPPIRRTGRRPCGARAARSCPPARAFRPEVQGGRTPGEPGCLVAWPDPPLGLACCHHAPRRTAPSAALDSLLWPVYIELTTRLLALTRSVSARSGIRSVINPCSRDGDWSS